MRNVWRNLAIVFFVLALLVGTLFGDRLLAVPDQTRSDLRAYTELMQMAHAHYGVEVTYRDLVYASIRGMLRSLDPHTSFLSPEDFDNMRQRQQASFYGLGILVSMRNGQLTIRTPIEGTPAWRLGLRAGDIIHTIEGEPTDSMGLDDAISRLKGPKGTSVDITILRRGLDEPLPLTVTRAEIPQTTVRFAYMLKPDTGYIRITDFARSTANEVRTALESLREQGMERLILDLRSNGGGLLDQAVEASAHFVPVGEQIVETRGRVSDANQSYSASGGDVEPLAMPLMVLVNSGTASAAEILSGAIQDHDMGLVLGTPTWGKGLVQTVYNLSFGAGVALTTAKYYTPAGRLIQRDYSSFFDYYTHFDNASSEDADADADAAPADGDATTERDDAPPAEAFTTDLGRTVYGGGGITPDILVEPERVPAMMQFLFARNAFFTFAVDLHDASPVTDPNWQPASDLIERFSTWLVAEELADEADVTELFADEEAGEIAQRQIHSDLLNAAFGTEASHRVLAEGDAQIQAALTYFDEAADLLRRRQSGEPLPVLGQLELPNAAVSVDGGGGPAPQPED
ncbi:MAG: S41 family peptidase [Acidobacteriota bacterium]